MLCLTRDLKAYFLEWVSGPLTYMYVFAETGSLDLGRVEWLLVSAQGNTSQA